MATTIPNRSGMARNTLVLVSNTAGDNFDRDYADFQSHFPGKRKREFGADLRTEAETVSGLPEPQTRRAEADKKMRAMKKIAGDALTEMKLGAGYVRAAFPKDEVEAMLKEAGLDPAMYAEVAAFKRPAVVSMFNLFFAFLAKLRLPFRTTA